MRARSSFIGMCLWIGLNQGCAQAQAATAPGRDEPVPSTEPRTELVLELDLPKTSTCEEDFDLALYAQRGVDLITWSKADRSCSGRQVRVRYLPRRVDRDKLLARVKELTTGVRVSNHE